MNIIIAALRSFWRNHGTKALGFAQVTIGTLAAATDVFSASVLKALLLANGLLVAWRGFFNSRELDNPESTARDHSGTDDVQ